MVTKRGRPRTRRGPRGKLATALIAARARRGMTQAQAAEALGLAWTTLARYETGSRVPRGPARRWIEQWIAEGADDDRAVGGSDGTA